MPVDRTRLKFRLFDRQRARLGLNDSLIVVKQVPATGYTDTSTISSGWYGERIEDRALGAEFFEVQIAESGTDLTVTLQSVTHLKMRPVGATLWRYHKFVGMEAPTGSLRVWLIRCNPTGEKKP